MSSQAKKMGLQQHLDSFACLKNSDPGTWLPIPRYFMLSVILIVVMILGWLFVWNEQWNNMEQAVAKEKELRDKWLESKKAAASLELYQQQKADIERSFGVLLKQLPNRSEIETLLVEVNQAGLGRGLQFDLFKPDAEQVKEFYAELPISVKVVGSYTDLGTFAADIARLPRIVTLNDIDLAKAPSSVQLAMNVKLKTFRYLEADELQGGKK
ncbi:MAG: type 4a pilus biogenesis protein PilO [Betaproteobacteria bacterium]|nr:type 4a pilus biogenesis protein PilO [Betaproteobacteria bacterium]